MSRHPGIRGGRGSGRRGRPSKAEEIEAEIRCECGTLIDRHPPLAKPRPWGYGRPCSRTSLDRGRGWDGRPLPEHTEAEQARWARHRDGVAVAHGPGIRVKENRP